MMRFHDSTALPRSGSLGADAPSILRTTPDAANRFRRCQRRFRCTHVVDDRGLSNRFFTQAGVVPAVRAAFATLLASAPRRQETLGKTGLTLVFKGLKAKADTVEV
jgi:hypothetical protein